MDDHKHGHGRNHELQWGHGREAMDGAAANTTVDNRRDFNGAMAVRPWMAAAAAGAAPAYSNFNGAMAVRPWMATGADRLPIALKRLQWGHGREAMDGWRESARDSLSAHFNGAMAVRPWMAAPAPL